MSNTQSPLLSIIVPVYNVEPYLRKCVDSLLAQDYSDYEIILVDDGSTDSCPAMCDEYASHYPNIHTMHQPNSGLSVARNSGITLARGKYICFVDSDDYWEPNVLGGLMAQVERENLDVLRFNYQNVNEKYNVFNPVKTMRIIDERTDVVNGETYLNTRMGYACYAVMFIVRRALVLGNEELNLGECMFTEGIHFEDVDWLPRMMLRAERVNSTSIVVYNYLIRQGSITQEANDLSKRECNVNDALYVIEQLNKLETKYSGCHWLKEMRSSMALAILHTVAKYLYPQRKTYINQLKVLRVFPISLKNKSVSFSCKINLCNFSPWLMVFVLHILSGLRK
ncbi:MAG: glycosyltransferase [Bacteroidales bacterium]|nr:glycosyltransferase [Bacteroidales bacterium]